MKTDSIKQECGCFCHDKRRSNNCDGCKNLTKGCKHCKSSIPEWEKVIFDSYSSKLGVLQTGNLISLIHSLLESQKKEMIERIKNNTIKVGKLDEDDDRLSGMLERAHNDGLNIAIEIIKDC